jgi:hypothetical protein
LGVPKKLLNQNWIADGVCIAPITIEVSADMDIVIYHDLSPENAHAL